MPNAIAISSHGSSDKGEPEEHNGTVPVQPAATKTATVMPKFPMPTELPPTEPPSEIHTLSLFDLSGKTALVTGANGGIGGGMSRGLADAGADIIIFQIPGEMSNFHEELAAATGRKTFVYECDMGDSLSIRHTVQKVLDDGHHIDILCNVAGISSGSIPILHETDGHKDAVRSHLVFLHEIQARGANVDLVHICLPHEHR